MTTIDTPVRRKRPVSKPKFAAKCIADNYGRRGSTTWLAVFNATREVQALNGITAADFEGMSLDEIRANASLRD